MNHNYFGVIMAGGIGSRFWPMSTTKNPKQFHDILGTGKTLIQQTFQRLNTVIPAENIFVITNKEYVSLTLSQLPQLKENQVIGEPTMMNTAPCNLYMAKKIHQLNPDASMIVAPSDHVILNENEFAKLALQALEKTQENDYLITLGIKPSRPDTGYGYIQFIENQEKSLKKVKTFTEKPNEELAKQFLASGDFLWNAGIFIWSTKSILKSFSEQQEDMYNTFSSVDATYNSSQENEAIEKIYPTVSKISIDYAIMEKADNVYVIPSDFGWSDLGTWASLFENFNKDENENAIKGKFVRTYNSKGNIIQTSDKKAVIVEGLENYIIADTKDALLICPIEKDQKVKEFVQDLKLNKGEIFL